MSKLARLGVIGVAATTLGMVAVPSANAMAWNSSAPTKATNVTSVATYSLGKGGADGTLQIRRGTYNGKKYYWGRIYNPASKYNTGHYIRFQIQALAGKTCSTVSGSSSRHVDRTTYTDANLAAPGCSLSLSLRTTPTGKILYSTSYSV